MVVLGVPVRDTCKEVREGLVQRTVARETLVDLMGPWLISRAALAAALDQGGAVARAANPLQLFSAAGLPIRVVMRG